MTDTKAYEFFIDLQKYTTSGESAARFREAIAPFGFNTFACGELDLRDRDRTIFYIVDWPERWRRFYVESGMIERDPLIDELGKQRSPFTWSDLRTKRKLSSAGRKTLDLCAAQGWREGFVVPMPQSGNRVGLVSMVGSEPNLQASSRAYLALISICFHTHAKSLVAREGFPVPPAGLTDREIACLRLAARGVTDKGISQELLIAVSTAHEHIENAKRRLKVRSRAELVAIAAALGIIEI